MKNNVLDQIVDDHKEILLPEMDPELVSREIGDFMVDIVRSSGGTGGVIGISGGVDSMTAAALAKRAFDRHNAEHGTTYELVGYMLPSKTNAAADQEDGRKVAERLGIRYELLSIEPLVESYKTTNPEAFTSKFHKGNLTSRIRGTVLNTKGSTEHKTVIGTGNKDEDFGIGYYTLFGDGAVHCSPIGGLSKRLVRQMARHLGFSDLADREPTAGLEPKQTDFGDLGYSYDLVEIVSEGLEQGCSPESLTTHPQVVPVFARDNARYTALFGTPKFRSADQAVYDILQRNNGANAKASIIHPPSPDITLHYASRGAR